MANELCTVEKTAKDFVEIINKIAKKYDVNALELAAAFGASIGAPVEVVQNGG